MDFIKGIFPKILSWLASNWYVPVFAVVLSLNYCQNQSKIDGLNKIIDMNRTSYQQEINTIKNGMAKEKEDRDKIQKVFDKQINEMQEKYVKDLEEMKNKEGKLVEELANNPASLEDILKKYGLVRGTSK